MRAFLSTVVCMLVLGPPLSLAAEAPKSNPPANPVAQHLQDMRKTWPEPGTKINVKFVMGHDVWQPRQQFKTGRDWLALACNAKGCALEAANLNVKQEFWQGHYDDKPTFGQRLAFSRGPGGHVSEVVAWFSSAAVPAWLKPGAVTTYHSPRHSLKQPVGRGTLEVTIDKPDGESAQLVPMLVTRDVMQRLLPGSRDSWSSVILQLRAQGKRQLLEGHLGSCSGTFHPRQYLQWAGDLDRDGKADYLISFIDADGPVHLYLSSAAKPGQLVGLAGIYESPPHGGECEPGGYQEWPEAEHR